MQVFWEVMVHGHAVSWGVINYSSIVQYAGRLSRNPPHSRLDRIWNTSCTSPCRDLLTSILTKTQGQTFFFIASPVEQTTGGVPQNYLGVSKIDTDRLIPPFRLQVFLYSVSNTHDHLQQMPPEGLLKNMMLCPPPFR